MIGPEEEGQRRNGRHRFDGIERCEVHPVHVEAAKHRDLKRVTLGAELSARIGLDVEASIRPLTEEPCHLVHCLHGRIV